MKFYKLRITQNSASVASAFNESFKPEIIPDSTDPYKIDWITEANEEALVGEKVWLPLSFPHPSFGSVLTGG
jgi:actin-related protein 8